MKMACVINSLNGRVSETRVRAALASTFGDMPCPIYRTDFPGHAAQIAQVEAERGTQALIVVGGDGTINEVINGIKDWPVALGIIPTGTANDLARHLNIPDNIEKACAIIAERRTQSHDLISVNGWRYATVGGIGLGCDAIKQMEVLRAKLHSTIAWKLLQHRLYLASLLLTYRRTVHHPFSVTVATNGHSYSTHAVSVILANQPMVGKLFNVAPGASASDGKLDIFMIESARGGRAIAQSVASTLVPIWKTCQAIHRFPVTNAAIILSSPASFFGDGELREPASYFKIEVLPRALSVFVPRPEDHP